MEGEMSHELQYYAKTYTVHSSKKYEGRSKGQGRRFCLGDRIYSISCRASYCDLGRFKEWDELHPDDLKKRMNSSYSSKSSYSTKYLACQRN